MSSHILSPVAEGMLRARSYAEYVGADHRSKFDLPMTPMAGAHVMRSTIQALVATGEIDGFTLEDNYLAFGRVEVVHEATKQHYLLKARNALPFEAFYQGTLFDGDAPPGTQPLLLLLYGFDSGVLAFATVPAERFRSRNGRVRYQLIGEIVDAGTWSPDGLEGIEPFDQGQNDDFGDLSEDVRLGGDANGETS